MDSKANTAHFPGGEFREQFSIYQEKIELLTLELEYDDDDIEELKKDFYKSARKANKISFDFKYLPNKDRDSPDAKKDYTSWVKLFIKHLKTLGMKDSINPEKVCGFPKIPSIEVPDEPNAPADGIDNYEALKAAYDEAMAARDLELAQFRIKFEKFLERYQDAVFLQNSVSSLISNCCQKNALASAAIENIADNDIVGYMTFAVLEHWIINAKGRDMLVAYRDAVMDISKMHSDQDILDFISAWKPKWATFVDQFSDKVTEDNQEPWAAHLPNSQICNKILDALPNEADWRSFRIALDSTTLEKCPMSFVAELQKRMDTLQRGSATTTLPVAPATQASGDVPVCRWCEKNPKGVPAYGHKPSDSKCPHHAQWKKKKAKFKKLKAKKKQDKAGKGSSESTGEAPKTKDQEFMLQMAEVVSKSTAEAVSSVLPQALQPMQHQLNQLTCNVAQALERSSYGSAGGGHPGGQYQLANVAYNHQPQPYGPPLNYHGAPPQHQAPGSVTQDHE